MDSFRHAVCGLAAWVAVGAFATAFVEADRDVPAEPQDTDRDVHNLVLLAPAHPVFIRIQVQVDGRGLKSVRTAYAAKLVDQYDNDGDRLLDRDEARAVPPLVKSASASEMVLIADRWEAVDRDPADDKVSVEELGAYIDRIFGSTFLLSVKSLRATQSIDLFSLLDVNRDGRLSRDEFEAAPRTLHKLDIDDDETFTIDELQPFRNPQISRAPALPAAQNTDQPFLLLDDADAIAKAAEQLQRRYGDIPSPTGAIRLSRAALDVAEAAFSSRDSDGDGAFDAGELAAFLRSPVPHLELGAQLLQSKPGKPKIRVIEDRISAISKDGRQNTDKVAISANGIGVELRVQTNRTAVADNRSFYKLKFRTADQDKNGYLSEQEFAAVGLPNADFKSVDRNGDGMVVEAELMDFVAQESASSQSRVEMSITHDGKSVFEIIDANLDRRISRRELVHAFERLRPYDRDGDEAIIAVELAGRFKGALELGKPSLFRARDGGMMRGDMATPIVSAPTSGPEWFRKMDRNRDGDVSLREFLGPLAAFKKLDADADGLITAAEAEKAEEIRAAAGH